MRDIIIPTCCIHAIRALADAERGRLMLAAVDYCCERREPDLKGGEKYIWPEIKAAIDEAEQEALGRSAMNSAKGKLGGRPKKAEKAAAFTPPSSPLKPPNNPQKERVSKDTPKKKTPKPPTLAEVEAYCKERGSSVDPKDFWDFFEAGDWVDSKGKPVLAWKQKLLTWEKYQPSSPIKGGEDAHTEPEHTLSPPKRWHKTGDFEGYWEVQNEQGEWVKRDA